MAIETEKSKILLDKVNSFKTEFDLKRKSNSKKVSIDKMVVNLGNPRLAEKIRIHKVWVGCKAFSLDLFCRAYYYIFLYFAFSW